MRKGRKFAAAVAAALFVSAVPMSAFGAVIKYSPEKTSTVSSSKESVVERYMGGDYYAERFIGARRYSD